MEPGLAADGTLVSQSDQRFLVFPDDRVFNSVSAAVAVVYGRNSNGRTEWRVEGSTQTDAEWQEDQTKVI